jgi:hypothetical protein
MKREDSLFRPELEYLDFVDQSDGGPCGDALDIGNGVVHYCTRPPGHDGQHYSFRSGSISYEIVWPATP